VDERERKIQAEEEDSGGFKMMRRALLVLSALLLIVSGSRLYGQGATGTILGTVTDTSGAVLPNVKVTVTNTATNQSYNTVTSSAGDFNAPSLNPGSYKVSATAPGFQKSVTTAFTLTVDDKVRIDLSLKPGAVTETMEVTAQAVQLDTDSAALSQEMSGEQVAELPLNGRNFMQLLLVGAGAVTVGGEQGTMRQGEGAAVSINGGRPEGNNYTLDGLVNTDAALVTPAVILSQDAIGEFKVESGTYPAEYGFSASQINIVSKGGTNSLHGAIFETNRNDAYDALPFPNAQTESIATDANPNKTVNPVLRQNQFGFVASGPVYIPKIYNGRNKTFWMANYEGWRVNNGNRVNESVPNPATLTGDFSAETYQPLSNQTVNGVSVPLPGGPLPAYGTVTCTALLQAGGNCMPVDPTTGQAYPGNVIPQSAQTARLAQVAIASKFWATPTIPNSPEGKANYVASIPGILTTNQQTYRGDQTLGKLGSVFGRYTHANYVNHSLYNSGSLDYGIESYFEKQDSWAVSHTINIGSKNVNNFRFGHLSANAPEGNELAPTPDVVSALNETGVFTKFGPLQQSYPNIGLTTYASGGGSVNGYSGSEGPSWEFADSFTSIHGKHTLQFGVSYRKWRLIRNLDDDFYGDFGFGAATIQKNNEAIGGSGENANNGSCPNAPVVVAGSGSATPLSLCGTGNAVADMLLGYYSSVGGFVPGPLSPQDQAGNPQDHVFSYFAPYVEDSWKVTQKLSLNYGLRWDYRAAAYEASNHFFWRDTQNPDGGLCYADPALTTNGVAPGVGIDGVGPILRYCGRVPHEGSKKPFAPRFGVNYRFTDKTVVRGGYGIFFDSAEGREIDDSADIYPYSIRNNLTPATTGTVPKLTNDLFPAYTTLGPFPESTLSFIAVIESSNPINPYVQSWTLSVERELAANTTLEVNYIGTHALHLLDRRNISQPLQIQQSDLAFCQELKPDGTPVHLNDAPCTTTSRLPYKNFNGFYIDSDWAGYSHYNAMNIKFEHRAKDLAVTGVFTWARSLDDKSAAAGVGATGSGYQGFEDNHNPNRDYGPSDFNVDHRFVSSYVWQLPFGRGKKFASGINRAADVAIGGWQLSGITTFQTGFPYSVGGSDLFGYNGSNNPHPDVIPGCKISDHTAKYQRINLACFSNAAPGVYGTLARNTLRQPGINNFDVGFGKFFSFGEHVKFKFNLDTFNTFNHHQYAGDVGGLIVGGSGGNQVIDASTGSGAATGGKITGSSSPRILQLSGKIVF
jgi:hypothetical protein